MFQSLALVNLPSFLDPLLTEKFRVLHGEGKAQVGTLYSCRNSHDRVSFNVFVEERGRFALNMLDFLPIPYVIQKL
jgi:hypothetical protein